MSADILRQAAALMRERAEAARDVTGASDWHIGTAWAPGGDDGWVCYAVRSSGGRVSTESSEEEATHIASWNPAVAASVADWLDACAEKWHPIFPALCDQRAVSVARAYLGVTS